MSEDIGFLDIAELGARYRDGRLTPLMAVRQGLARIAALEGRLNAFADPMAELALADAERRTQELAAGQDLGPLHGIAVAIKDLIDVAGVPTGFGTRARQPPMAERDAELVARLRAAGAVILGKTNLLEYAYGVAHPEVGQTNNPHDFTRTSGGSSGGSAAAVAAGIVPLAIGTDTGGSIRIPAAYCGLVGLKPSFGLVPLEGVFPLAWSLDHAGPLTRSVEDAAIALACLGGETIALRPVALAGLRIGMVRSHWASQEITPGVRQCLEVALARLRVAGAQLIEIDIAGLREANAALGTLLRPEAWVIHADLLPANPDGYAAQTRAQLEAGSAVRAVDYLLAKRLAGQIGQAVERAFATIDVLISPSVPFVAPLTDPVIEEGEEGEMLSSGFANLTGHPSLSLPAGLSQGLPVGLQLTGALRHDADLLAIAKAMQTVLPRYHRPKVLA